MRIKKKYLQEKTDTSEKARKAIEDMVHTVEDELSVNEPEAKEFVKNYVIGSDVSESEDLNEVGPGKVHTKKFDRCVKDVKKNSPDVDNPYAICQASLGAKAIKKSHQRKEDYTNESSFTMTKGELIESLNIKRGRKVIKTIKVKDIKND
jgi:hypothetical protein